MPWFLLLTPDLRSKGGGGCGWGNGYLAASALLLRFDAPWQVGLVVRVEDVVVDLGVDIFRIYQ